jgi:formylglycine-generating enzyme
MIRPARPPLAEVPLADLTLSGKLLAPGGSPEIDDGGAWAGKFTMDASRAEPKGYLAAMQTPDGMMHFISSALHYRLNLA